MKPADIENRLRQIPWSAPSADLRVRVLSAVPVTSPTISWSDRVWFSRAWRLAAVATGLVLAVLESMSAPARSSATVVSAQVVAETSFVDETVRQAGLSPQEAAMLARRVVAAERKARSGLGFGATTLDDLDMGGEPR